MGETAFNGITPQPIGASLTADMFYFRRDIPQMKEGAHHLELTQPAGRPDYHADRIRPHVSHYREKACL